MQTMVRKIKTLHIKVDKPIVQVDLTLEKISNKNFSSIKWKIFLLLALLLPISWRETYGTSMTISMCVYYENFSSLTFNLIAIVLCSHIT